MYSIKGSYFAKTEVSTENNIPNDREIFFDETKIVNFEVIKQPQQYGYTVYVVELKHVNNSFINDLTSGKEKHIKFIITEVDTGKEITLYLLPATLSKVTMGTHFGQVRFYCISRLTDALKNDNNFSIKPNRVGRGIDVVQDVLNYIKTTYEINFTLSSQHLSNFQYQEFNIPETNVYDTLKYIYDKYPPFNFKIGWFFDEFDFNNFCVFKEFNVFEFESLGINTKSISQEVKLDISQTDFIKHLETNPFVKTHDFDDKNYTLSSTTAESYEETLVGGTDVNTTTVEVPTKEGGLKQLEIEEEFIKLNLNYDLTSFKERLELLKSNDMSRLVLRKFLWNGYIEIGNKTYVIDSNESINKEKLYPISAKINFVKQNNLFYFKTIFECVSKQKLDAKAN